MKNTGEPDAAPKKKWVYLVVGVLVAALLAGGLFLFLGDDEKSGGGSGRNRGKGIKQADWDVKVWLVGGPALPKKKQPMSKRGKKKLGSLVRSIYNAMFLRPDRMKGIAKRYVDKPAAAAIKKSQPFPRRARRIKTLYRVAEIAVDPRNSSRAAALVRVVARGFDRGKKFRTSSRDRLWLERIKGSWKVVAYDVDVKPVPLQPKKSEKEQEKDGRSKKKPKKETEKKKRNKGGGRS